MNVDMDMVMDRIAENKRMERVIFKAKKENDWKDLATETKHFIEGIEEKNIEEIYEGVKAYVLVEEGKFSGLLKALIGLENTFLPHQQRNRWELLLRDIWRKN